MICPACDHDNLPGEDLCADCGMDLAGLDVQAWGVDPDDPVLTTPLRELDLERAIVLGPDDSVAAAVKQMREAGTGCVFIETDGEGLVGIFTEHDVVSRVASRRRDPETTPLRRVMTPDPVVLRRDDPVAWALNRMGIDGFRHVPVVDGGRLHGFVSSRIVLKLLAG